MSTAIMDGKHRSWMAYRFVRELTSVRDNEKPLRKVKVHAFQAQGRPITNEEVSYRQHALNKPRTQS